MRQPRSPPGHRSGEAAAGEGADFPSNDLEQIMILGAEFGDDAKFLRALARTVVRIAQPADTPGADQPAPGRRSWTGPLPVLMPPVDVRRSTCSLRSAERPPANPMSAIADIRREVEAVTEEFVELVQIQENPSGVQRWLAGSEPFYIAGG
jgi:hypothetical protein